MNSKKILELSNHDIYYIKNEEFSYYVTVPKKFDTTNICLELKSKMHNYNLDMNDELWVMENVKNTFKFIDEYNITLVLPVFNDKDISDLEKIDNSKYDGIDKKLGKIINDTYKLLKEKNLEISNQVILINNERYKTFINWFVTRYKSRVICKNLLELIQIFNVNATAYKKLETPVINFVVGSYNTEVDAPKVEPKEELPQQQQLVPQTSSGFTTYWLLAAIVILVAGAIAFAVFLVK